MHLGLLWSNAVLHPWPLKVHLWGGGSMVELLPNMQKVLSLSLSAEKTNKQMQKLAVTEQSPQHYMACPSSSDLWNYDLMGRCLQAY